MPPVTPPQIWPTRDSPDNPFLAGEGEASVSKAGGWESNNDELPIGEAPGCESTPTPAPVFEEKPTITHVFQGQKATFHNPQYHLTPEAIEASKLPIDHPDFECRPCDCSQAPERESTPTPAPVSEKKPTITYVFQFRGHITSMSPTSCIISAALAFAPIYTFSTKATHDTSALPLCATILLEF
ncbi:hypothetical protein DFJ58DRAFT_891863 [Suillus subalutaceus]|uniref:uncharacterized protein n=1 Tax=Suillus subalutaceus TaxID=48586 RepID=UPI001B86D458|nr:uncharacterized protein DFJ58DRAFT_891863 [Suillus subalutaceus]KAG1847177.1 hypothetical protein DFJ58DRAFT_891863 [Suillus subalutaceus]